MWERLAGHVTVALAKFRAEESLRDSEAALKAADRRKNEFLAMLSHELRNPLTPIRNSLFLLEKGSLGGDQARHAHAVIDRQVGHLTRLVDDLLDVTRITRGKVQLRRERLDLATLVHRTLDDHRREFVENGVHLDVPEPREPIWVHADATRVAQVLGNLLANALKFTPPGGRVTVSLEQQDHAAMLGVRDSGIGMTADVMEHLFQPFTQGSQSLDRSRGGLGLGLALVKGLVELHGGTVSGASNGAGQGSEFIVRLPLDHTVEPLIEPGETTPFRRRRVLVIEDNVDAAETLRMALELTGHEVDVAYDGLAGLARARQFRPEIVLCDIGLPRVDGYEVARRFRADPEFQGLLLVALTGYASPEDRLRATDAGFADHLAKPVNLDTLFNILAKL